MTVCRFCNEDGLEWSETTNSKGKHFLYNPNTGRAHECRQRIQQQSQSQQQTGPAQPKLIPLFVEQDGIQKHQNPSNLAKAIIEEADRLGIKRYEDLVNLRTERRGDYLIVLPPLTKTQVVAQALAENIAAEAKQAKSLISN